MFSNRNMFIHSLTISHVSNSLPQSSIHSFAQSFVHSCVIEASHCVHSFTSCLFISLFIHSFVIHASICSIIWSWMFFFGFVCSYSHSVVNLFNSHFHFVHSLVQKYFTIFPQSFIHLFIHVSICLFICLFIHVIIRSLIYLYIHSFLIFLFVIYCLFSFSFILSFILSFTLSLLSVVMNRNRIRRVCCLLKLSTELTQQGGGGEGWGGGGGDVSIATSHTHIIIIIITTVNTVAMVTDAE